MLAQKARFCLFLGPAKPERLVLIKATPAFELVKICSRLFRQTLQRKVKKCCGIERNIGLYFVLQIMTTVPRWTSLERIQRVCEVFHRSASGATFMDDLDRKLCNWKFSFLWHLFQIQQSQQNTRATSLLGTSFKKKKSPENSVEAWHAESIMSCSFAADHDSCESRAFLVCLIREVRSNVQLIWFTCGMGRHTQVFDVGVNNTTHIPRSSSTSSTNTRAVSNS